MGTRIHQAQLGMNTGGSTMKGGSLLRGSVQAQGSESVKELNSKDGTLLESLDAVAAWQGPTTTVEGTDVRWHENHLKHLTIFLSKADPDWELAFRQATGQWQGAGLGLIRFYPVPMASQAFITIDFSDEAVEGRDFEVGHARRTVDSDGYIQHVDITLLRQPTIDQHLSQSRLQQRKLATLLHELGHALGLEHSQHSTDVMHHQGWQNLALSKSDLAALAQRYPHISRSSR